MQENQQMPIMFIGHGSPMNAIENNVFSLAWENIGKSLPVPKAILCISAHWFIDDLWVTAAQHQKTIYDFYGFPKELYEINYPAPGSPSFAEETYTLLQDKNAKLDFERGLDHGTWSILCRIYPNAKIPTYQLSINSEIPALYHFEIGKKIRELRSKGVLIIGSGNIVHNLRKMNFNNEYYDWAKEFDNRAMRLIEKRDFESLINYQSLGKEALLSIPTPDHYLPLLYILGASFKNEEISFFTEEITLGSISMRSLIIN